MDMFTTDDGIDVRTLTTAELSEEMGRSEKAKEWFTLEVCCLEMNRRDREARRALR